MEHKDNIDLKSVYSEKQSSLSSPSRLGRGPSSRLLSAESDVVTYLETDPQLKANWDKWSGNGKSPSVLTSLLQPHNPKASGMNSTDLL